MDQSAGGASGAVWASLGRLGSGGEGVWLIPGHADAKSRKCQPKRLSWEIESEAGVWGEMKGANGALVAA